MDGKIKAKEFFTIELDHQSNNVIPANIKAINNILIKKFILNYL